MRRKVFGGNTPTPAFSLRSPLCSILHKAARDAPTTRKMTLLTNASDISQLCHLANRQTVPYRTASLRNRQALLIAY
jgi:hypothetical protein